MKRVISLVFALLLISMMFTGCAQKDVPQTDTSSSESSTETVKGTSALTESQTEKITQTQPPTQAQKKADTWKQLYKDRIETYISGVDYKDDVEFSLVFIDNDDVPELVAGIPSHINAATLFWVHNDELHEEVMGYTISEGFTYVEKSGLIKLHGEWQGAGGDTIYELSSGTLTEIAEGTFNSVNNSYTWEGETVCAMDYDYMLNDVFSEEIAKDVVETVYGYGDIKSVIDSF